MTQTIKTAKRFLDAELVKYETWEASGEIARSLIKDEQAWHKIKATGVGRDTLVRFLGGLCNEKAHISPAKGALCNKFRYFS